MNHAFPLSSLLILFSLIHNSASFCLLKRKRTGNLIKLGRNTEGKIIYQNRRKILIDCSVQRLHVLMCKTVDKGGFKRAHAANGDIRFSEMTLRTYWPNWLKIMTDQDRNMCACKTCQTMNDLYVAYVAKRRKIIARTETTLKEMPGRFRMD